MFNRLLTVLGLCPCESHIFRRSSDGEMGLECVDCHRWHSVERELSEIGVLMEYRQRVMRESRRVVGLEDVC